VWGSVPIASRRSFRVGVPECVGVTIERGGESEG
jgi:hypothetical protein